MLNEIAYFLRALIEGIVAVVSIYMLAGRKTVWKVYTGVGFLIGTIAYIVRLLPVNYGIHTLVILLIMIFVVMGLGKFEFYKAASASIIFMIVLFLSEWLAILAIVNICNISTEDILDKSFSGLLIGLVPLALAFLVIITIHRIKKFSKK